MLILTGYKRGVHKGICDALKKTLLPPQKKIPNQPEVVLAFVKHSHLLLCIVYTLVCLDIISVLFSPQYFTSCLVLSNYWLHVNSGKRPRVFRCWSEKQIPSGGELKWKDSIDYQYAKFLFWGEKMDSIVQGRSSQFRKNQLNSYFLRSLQISAWTY